LISATTLATHVLQGDEVYILYYHPVNEPDPTRAEKACNAQTTDLDPQDPLDQLPKEYHDYQSVFSDEAAKTLPPHRSYDHKIELEEGTNPPYGKLYNMSEVELKVLKDYLDKMLDKGFVRASKLPAVRTGSRAKEAFGVARGFVTTVWQNPRVRSATTSHRRTREAREIMRMR
jgi:hypothetical protein